MKNVVRFLGTRGSFPLKSNAFSAYGGDTSCYVVELGDTSIIIDCGSGITKAANYVDNKKVVHLLITHPHLDHIGSLFSLTQMLKKNQELHIYGPTLEGKTIKEQIDQLIGPPLWPVRLDEMRQVVFHEVGLEPFNIEDVTIKTMESNHPGGCMLYRLEGNNASVVMAYDFNHSDGYDEKLIEFAMDADFMVYDGSMTLEEYDLHPSWGHSTPFKAVEIQEKAHINTLAVSHHGQNSTDLILDELEHLLRSKYDHMFFAYDGLSYFLGSPMPGYCSSGKTDNQANKLQNLMDICTKLTAEKDKNKLFEHIIRSAIEVTNADGGTLYTLEDTGLKFRVMITKSMGYFKGGSGDPIELPNVKLTMSNVASACALTHTLINIDNVYANEIYDFSGPRNYDQITGYNTRSVLVAPMENMEGRVIGVMQLINATDEDGKVVPFDKEDEGFVSAIASQAAISLSNINFEKQINELLYGFVRGIVTGIDARTPYNANHTRNMVTYGSEFIDYENATNGPYAMTQDEKQELVMSIWLHDIGKITTPLSIMDKSDRLGDQCLATVKARYSRRKVLLNLQQARGEFDEVELAKKLEELEEEKNFIMSIDAAGYLPDDKYDRLQKIASEKYKELDGDAVNKLTPIELHQLSIRKGTLTAEEREIMNNHVVMTYKILSNLSFPNKFSHVPTWASNHHEFIDGSGYPQKLSGDQLSWQGRLLTILDIFEALTAADRPYRNSMELDRAFSILDSMVEEGKLDGNVLAEFKKSDAWVSTMEKRKQKEIKISFFE